MKPSAADGIRPGPGLALLALLALVAMAGCAGRAGTAAQEASEDGVRIPYGQAVAIESGALEIRFDSVAGDSRCPKGETCVWEGDATVVLEARTAGEPAARLELHTAAKGPSVAAYGNWRIRLVALEPYPMTGRTIDAAAYVATVAVARDASGAHPTR